LDWRGAGFLLIFPDVYVKAWSCPYSCIQAKRFFGTIFFSAIQRYSKIPRQVALSAVGVQDFHHLLWLGNSLQPDG